MEGTRQRKPQAWRTRARGRPRGRRTPTPETPLQVAGRRYYSQGLGRWTSRDPIGEEGGQNLYAFAGCDAVTGIDPYGLWKSHVHDFLTGWWAFGSGYPRPAALAIGSACNAVDGGSTNPVTGDQSYHFDRDAPFGDPPDSRLRHKNEHYRLAMEACSDRLRADDPKRAVKELGLALHPLQDYYAHGDYGRLASGRVLHVHNETSTQSIPGHGSQTDYPDDPTLDARDSRTGRPDSGDGAAAHRARIPGRGNDVWYEYAVTGTSQRIGATETATSAILANYRSYLSVGATQCCKCLKYFGVRP